MLDPGIDVIDFALVDCSDGDRRVDAGKTTSDQKQDQNQDKKSRPKSDEK